MTAAASDRVRLDVRDGVASVVLSRPDKRNGLDLPMLEALVDTARRIAADPSVRVVIMSGAGQAFCAGLDFASVGKGGPRAMLKLAVKVPGQRTNLAQRACWVWRQLPVPVIAVVQGPCFGGGLQLALAADFRFAAPDAQLSVMEGKWGLIPDMTGSLTLRELVPADVAKRLAMTAEVIGAEQALEYGLVTGVSDDPMKDADALAAQLLQRSPDAVAYTKRLFHTTATAGPGRALWIETLLQARLMAGANHKIARRAGLAREVPAYVRRSVARGVRLPRR